MTNTHSTSPTLSLDHDERLLTRKLLRQIVTVSDMTIWRWERRAIFPRHLSVNGRNYWLLSEVKAWLANQRRGEAPSREEHHG